MICIIIIYLIDSHPIIYGNYLNIDISNSIFKNINNKDSVSIICNTKYSTINIVNTKFENMT